LVEVIYVFTGIVVVGPQVHKFYRLLPDWIEIDQHIFHLAIEIRDSGLLVADYHAFGQDNICIAEAAVSNHLDIILPCYNVTNCCVMLILSPVQYQRNIYVKFLTHLDSSIVLTEELNIFSAYICI